MNKSNRFRSRATESSPVTDVPGIGAVYGSRLRSQGIHTVGDLRRFQECNDRGDFQATMKSMIGARCDYAGNTYDALNNSSSRSCYSPVSSTPIRTRSIDFGYDDVSSPCNATSAISGSLNQTARNKINVVPPTVAILPEAVTRSFGCDSTNNQNTANAVPTAAVQETTSSTTVTTSTTASSDKEKKPTSKELPTTKVTSSLEKTNGSGFPVKPINVTLPTSNNAMMFGVFASPSEPESTESVAASSVVEETSSASQQSTTTAASSQSTTKDPTRSVDEPNTAMLSASHKNSGHVAMSQRVVSPSFWSIPLLTASENSQKITDVAASSVPKEKSTFNHQPTSCSNQQTTLASSQSTAKEATGPAVKPKTATLPATNNDSGNVEISKETVPTGNQKATDVVASSVAEGKSTSNQQSTSKVTSSQDTTNNFVLPVTSINVTLPTSNNGTIFGVFSTPSVPESKLTTAALTAPAINQNTTTVSTSSVVEETSSCNQQSTTVPASNQSTTKDLSRPVDEPQTAILPASNKNSAFDVFSTPSVTAANALSSTFKISAINQQPKTTVASTKNDSSAQPASNKDSVSRVFSTSSVPRHRAVCHCASSATSRKRKPAPANQPKPFLFTFGPATSTSTFVATSSVTEGTSSSNQQSTITPASSQEAHDNTPINSTAIQIDREQFAEMKLILNMMTNEILVLNLLKANQRVSPAIEKSAAILKFLAKQIMSVETQTMLDNITAVLFDTDELHVASDANTASTAEEEIKKENVFYCK